ncbi:hypothetical protein COLO4_02261 [Corchorus olitorius]|uniref:Uncharacterized protein n=1 Tax=Corchorus olitorius TaxID=93759 RepID=A0A1R3L1B2_9ROSI|nr:hypothetical protein COLO4_02261 [Corchorus olitorius]
MTGIVKFIPTGKARSGKRFLSRTEPQASSAIERVDQFLTKEKVSYKLGFIEEIPLNNFGDEAGSWSAGRASLSPSVYPSLIVQPSPFSQAISLILVLGSS